MSANCEGHARFDIAARGFWNSGQRAYFDVRVFNPFSQCYSKAPLRACHRRNEMEKRRSYEERITSVENGSFIPLVFTTAGGLGPVATIFYKRLTTMISELHDQPYSRVLHWIRCHLAFSFCSIACLKKTPWGRDVARLNIHLIKVGECNRNRTSNATIVTSIGVHNAVQSLGLSILFIDTIVHPMP